MNVSICGLGIMGNNHLRICKLNGYKIISKYDPINGDDYIDFLKSLKNSNALIIASPTIHHTKNILDALEINPKLKILCEKPISFNTNDKYINNILEFEKNILVGQVERFNPVIVYLKNLLSSLKENIIQIKTTRVNNMPSREAIDVRKDIGIHDLDAVCYLLNDTPKHIQVLNNDLEKNKNHENLFYNINNIQIINEISWKYPYKDRRINLLTDSGIYEAHYFNQTLKYIDWSNNEKKIDLERKEPLNEEVKFLEKMFVEDMPSTITVSNNLKLLQLLGY